MKRISGQFIETSSYDETVKAFIPAQKVISCPLAANYFNHLIR